MSPKLAFVGDIHGCVDPLKRILAELIPMVDHVVFLGDYVNRGPSSRQVLDVLLELRKTGTVEVSMLRGNHDAMFRRVLLDPRAESDFLRMGGAATIRSYVDEPYVDVFGRLRDSVPESHIELLDSLADSWSDGEVFATHQAQDAVNTANSAYVVVGHSVQMDASPSIRDRLAHIDTGCGTIPNGRLTALLWPSRDAIQVQAPFA